MANTNKEERDMKGCLHFENRISKVYEGSNTVGRHPHCVVTINDIAVSQYHAIIIEISGKKYVSDLKSCNGTFLNGHKLNAYKLYLLENGVSLKFANINSVYKEVDANLEIANTLLDVTQNFTQSFYNAATQQFIEHSVPTNNSLHEAQTQVFVREAQNNSFIHDLPTQVVDHKIHPSAREVGNNSFIHDLPTQVVDYETHPTFRKAGNNSHIHDLPTQVVDYKTHPTLEAFPNEQSIDSVSDNEDSNSSIDLVTMEKVESQTAASPKSQNQLGPRDHGSLEDHMYCALTSPKKGTNTEVNFHEAATQVVAGSSSTIDRNIFDLPTQVVNVQLTSKQNNGSNSSSTDVTTIEKAEMQSLRLSQDPEQTGGTENTYEHHYCSVPSQIKPVRESNSLARVLSDSETDVEDHDDTDVVKKFIQNNRPSLNSDSETDIEDHDSEPKSEANKEESSSITSVKKPARILESDSEDEFVNTKKSEQTMPKLSASGDSTVHSTQINRPISNSDSETDIEDHDSVPELSKVEASKTSTDLKESPVKKFAQILQSETVEARQFEQTNSNLFASNDPTVHSTLMNRSTFSSDSETDIEDRQDSVPKSIEAEASQISDDLEESPRIMPIKKSARILQSDSEDERVETKKSSHFLSNQSLRRKSKYVICSDSETDAEDALNDTDVIPNTQNVSSGPKTVVTKDRHDIIGDSFMDSFELDLSKDNTRTSGGDCQDKSLFVNSVKETNEVQRGSDEEIDSAIKSVNELQGQINDSSNDTIIDEGKPCNIINELPTGKEDENLEPTQTMSYFTQPHKPSDDLFLPPTQALDILSQNKTDELSRTGFDFNFPPTQLLNVEEQDNDPFLRPLDRSRIDEELLPPTQALAILTKDDKETEADKVQDQMHELFATQSNEFQATQELVEALEEDPQPEPLQDLSVFNDLLENGDVEGSVSANKPAKETPIQEDDRANTPELFLKPEHPFSTPKKLVFEDEELQPTQALAALTRDDNETDADLVDNQMQELFATQSNEFQATQQLVDVLEDHPQEVENVSSIFDDSVSDAIINVSSDSDKTPQKNVQETKRGNNLRTYERKKNPSQDNEELLSVSSSRSKCNEVGQNEENAKTQENTSSLVNKSQVDERKDKSKTDAESQKSNSSTSSAASTNRRGRSKKILQDENEQDNNQKKTVDGVSSIEEVKTRTAASSERASRKSNYNKKEKDAESKIKNKTESQKSESSTASASSMKGRGKSRKILEGGNQKETAVEEVTAPPSEPSTSKGKRGKKNNLKTDETKASNAADKKVNKTSQGANFEGNDQDENETAHSTRGRKRSKKEDTHETPSTAGDEPAYKRATTTNEENGDVLQDTDSRPRRGGRIRKTKDVFTPPTLTENVTRIENSTRKRRLYTAADEVILEDSRDSTENMRATRKKDDHTPKNIRNTRTRAKKTPEVEVILPVRPNARRKDSEDDFQFPSTSKASTGRNTGTAARLQDEVISISSASSEEPFRKSRRLSANSRANRNKQIKESPSSSIASTPERSRRTVKPKVVFTMVPNSESFESTIRALGGSVVNNIEASTVLVTESVKRTLKLLAAVGHSKPICPTSWIKECKKVSKFLDPWDYIIEDEEAEAKWNFSLRESLTRSGNWRLFENYTFQIMTNTAADVLKGAIEACGGKCVNRNLHKATTKNLVVIATEADRNKYTKVVKQNNKIVAVEPEGILEGVLRQELRFERYLLTL